MEADENWKKRSTYKKGSYPLFLRPSCEAVLLINIFTIQPAASQIVVILGGGLNDGNISKIRVVTGYLLDVFSAPYSWLPVYYMLK